MTTRNLGIKLLAIFLILWGWLSLYSIGQVGVIILALLAIVAGVFLLLGR